MQAEQSIVVDPKSPGGINSPHGLILFDGVCVLCSRGCRFVSKRDRRGYFRFVPIQLAEGRPLAEQLGIDPDRPDSFAFVASGRAYVKSEAALRIARELPRWQSTRQLSVGYHPLAILKGPLVTDRQRAPGSSPKFQGSLRSLSLPLLGPCLQRASIIEITYSRFPETNILLPHPDGPARATR
jgi:predicted DCC family thiol-disulfide oxidoreductase YuxK